MRGVRLLLLAVALGNASIAGDFQLCLQNPARLDEDTVQSFRSELERIFSLSGRSAAFTCGPAALNLTFRNDPPGEESSALGAIRVRDGAFVPEIDLFVGPTAQMIGVRLPSVLGRALARVATHEIGHWMTRNAAHAAGGVMMERLGPGHLMASDRTLFRLPPAE